MTPTPLQIYPVRAAVQTHRFDLIAALDDALTVSGVKLADGDVLAVSSKYTAISEGRIVDLADVVPSEDAERVAAQYNMNPKMAQLVLENAEHVFGGIQLGFLLTHVHGVSSCTPAPSDRSKKPRARSSAS